MNHPTHSLHDEGLIAFISWCRSNDARFVYDPEIARRVYDAYCRIVSTA